MANGQQLYGARARMERQIKTVEHRYPGIVGVMNEIITAPNFDIFSRGRAILNLLGLNLEYEDQVFCLAYVLAFQGQLATATEPQPCPPGLSAMAIRRFQTTLQSYLERHVREIITERLPVEEAARELLQMIFDEGRPMDGQVFILGMILEGPASTRLAPFVELTGDEVTNEEWVAWDNRNPGLQEEMINILRSPAESWTTRVQTLQILAARLDDRDAMVFWAKCMAYLVTETERVTKEETEKEIQHRLFQPRGPGGVSLN